MDCRQINWIWRMAYELGLNWLDAGERDLIKTRQIAFLCASAAEYQDVNFLHVDARSWSLEKLVTRSSGASCEDKNNPALRIRWDHSPNHLRARGCLWNEGVVLYFDARTYMISSLQAGFKLQVWSHSCSIFEIRPIFKIGHVAFEEKYRRKTLLRALSESTVTVETWKPD